MLHGKFKQAFVVTCIRVPTVTHELSPRTPHNLEKKLSYSNCSPEMILNKVSNSVVCTFSSDKVCLILESKQAVLLELSRGKASRFLHAEHGVFRHGPSTPMCFGAMRVRAPSQTRVLSPTYHRQPSRGPVEASRLLSVSEARVCSVDMDEMSLMDDD